MHHSDFIAILAKMYKPRVYLELGIYMGETFGKVRQFAKRSIGVDLVLPVGLEGELYKESTDSFFKHFYESVDMIFIDADHSYESVKKDLDNSFQIINKPGIIILHDTDPERKGLLDPGYCNDCYKIVKDLEMDDSVNAVTLPLTEAGLTIITWKNQLRLNE